MNHELNKSLIKRHEGLRLSVYQDTRGIATVGYGCNLETQQAKSLCARVDVDFGELLGGKIELTPEQADAIFEMQYAQVIALAGLVFTSLDQLPDEAAAVIADMIFNLGSGAFQGFRNFIAAVKAERWAVAIEEMENSTWAKQVPNRVKDDVALMETIGADPVLRG